MIITLRNAFSDHIIFRHGFSNNTPICGGRTTEGRTKSLHLEIEFYEFNRCKAGGRMCA